MRFLRDILLVAAVLALLGALILLTTEPCRPGARELRIGHVVLAGCREAR